MNNNDRDLIIFATENLNVNALTDYVIKNHKNVLEFLKDIAEKPFDRKAYLAASNLAFAAGANGDSLAEQIDEIGKAVLRKAADHFTDDSELLSLLGESCLADEEYEEAVKWLEKALSAPKTTNWTVFLLGLARLYLKDYVKSIAYFKMCKYFIKENNSWKFNYWEKDCAGEIEFLEILSEESPQKKELFWALGIFNILEGDIEKGKEYFGRFSLKNYLLFDSCQWFDLKMLGEMAILGFKLKSDNNLYSYN